MTVDTNFSGTGRFPITAPALRWLEEVLAERFGHAWRLRYAPDGMVLKLQDADGAVLFDNLIKGMTEARSDQPCSFWDSEIEGWVSPLGLPLPAPGATELPLPVVEVREGAQVVHYDILGLTYWMLARVEETHRTELDGHMRFPAVASHAHRHGYLDRPVVDEWLHLLGQVIQRQWPSLRLKKLEASVRVTCDVDNPYLPENYIKLLVRRAVKGLVKNRSLAALKTLISVVLARLLGSSWDPYREGIDFIMDVNERAGRSVEFYFISRSTDSRLDTNVRLDEPRMLHLLREIHARGHEIGLHPGYKTYLDREELVRAVETSRRVLGKAGIEKRFIGSRQHFLRWQTPLTARLLSGTELCHDSTLGYADFAGFRCGTCFEYPFFDAIEQCELNLRIRPLILMEGSVLSDQYMGMDHTDKVSEVMQMYRDRCLAVNGTFNLLWHNCHLVAAGDRKIYEVLVQ